MARREALGKGVGALFSDQETDVKTSESPAITDNSEVVSKKLEVITPEQPEVTDKSEVVSKKSEVITLGETEKDQLQRFGKRGPKKRQRSSAVKTKQMREAVDQELLEQAIVEALKNPRVSAWSPLAMSTLRYLQLTTARFSMSNEVCETLETAFKEKYPELFKKIEKELEGR